MKGTDWRTDNMPQVSVRQSENLNSVCYECISIYRIAVGINPIAKTLEIRKALEIEMRFARNINWINILLKFLLWLLLFLRNHLEKSFYGLKSSLSQGLRLTKYTEFCFVLDTQPVYIWLPTLTHFVTLGKWVNFFILHFLTCKMGMILIASPQYSFSQGLSEKMRIVTD